MNNNEQALDQLLDDWTNNKISLEEVNQLSGSQDAGQISQEAQLHQLAIEAVVQYGIAQQVAKVHAMYAHPGAVPVKQSGTGFMYWSVRIAAVLVLMLGTYLASQQWIHNTERVFDNTFQEYYVGNERGEAAKKADDLIAHFKAQNYQQVIADYQQLAAPTQREKFLTGYAYLYTEQIPASIALLESVLTANRNSGIQEYQDDAEYYIALAYLKNGETRKAKLLLEAIYENPEHTYHDNVDNFDLIILKWFY